MGIKFNRPMSCVSCDNEMCTNSDCPHYGVHEEHPLCGELCHSCGGTCIPIPAGVY